MNDRHSSARPTIRDVAAAADVSRGTVSRVLNGGRNVSPRASAAVQKAIRDTGYIVNRSARNLARRRTDCVAFILSEQQEKLFEDPNFAVLLRSVTRALAETDRTVVVMLAGDEAGRERALRYTHAGHIDGAILVSTHAGDPLVQRLADGPVPVVSCGRTGRRAVPYAAADDRGGARVMTRYLIDRGRERVATIAGPQDMCSGIDRLRGYRDAIRARHLCPRVVSATEYGVSAGEECMSRLLRDEPGLDAVFIASDLLVPGALQALRRAGRDVGRDVLVGGFDDSRIAETTDPPLTTMHQPLALIGERTCELLLRVMAGRSVRSTVIPTELVRRRSA